MVSGEAAAQPQSAHHFGIRDYPRSVGSKRIAHVPSRYVKDDKIDYEVSNVPANVLFSNPSPISAASSHQPNRVIMSTLMSCLSAKTESPAVIIPNETNSTIASHSQLLDHILSFQKKLAAIGISPKEAVGIALPNSLEFIISFLATSLQRAICAPLNPAYKQEEFEFYLEDLKAPLVLVPKGAIAGNGEAIRAARKCDVAIAEVYWNGSEVSLEVGEQDGPRNKKLAEMEKPEADDVALILHTSGTTGRPKAVCARKFV